VTADGRFLRANDKENPDLYWGLRGGGGNFGVVTSIEYRLHDMDPVILGGTIVWPVAQARDVLRYYRDIALDAPDVVNLSPALYSGPDGAVIEIEACWSGDRAQGEAWLRKLRAFGKASHDDIAPMPYVAIQTSADELLAPGRYYYMKTGMLTQLKDDGIDLLIDSFKRMPDWYLLFFDHCGGAYRHMAPAATAFPNRDMLFTLGTHSIWTTRDGIEENTAMMRQLARTGTADQGFLYQLRGFGRHDGGLPRQLRRQFRTAGRSQGQVRSKQPVSVERERAAQDRVTTGPGARRLLGHRSLRLCFSARAFSEFSYQMAVVAVSARPALRSRRRPSRSTTVSATPPSRRQSVLSGAGRIRLQKHDADRPPGPSRSQR
jgi:hypothetical protein